MEQADSTKNKSVGFVYYRVGGGNKNKREANRFPKLFNLVMQAVFRVSSDSSESRTYHGFHQE